MTNWVEYKGRRQKIAGDVWVEIKHPYDEKHWPTTADNLRKEDFYRILNQHLIDAARLEGIRLGLKAAAREACFFDNECAQAILRFDPETIAREAVLDQLVSEAQAQGMGYETEADQ